MSVKRSAKKQIDKRRDIINEVQEYICDRCRLPDILDEDALPAACDECEVGTRLEKLL